jgi:hypothetical protein
MSNQLIPPPGLEPPMPDRLTHGQLFQLWIDVMDTGEALLLAGLRRQIGPDGDLQAAYRKWYERRMEEHDEALRVQAENLFRRGVRHGH